MIELERAAWPDVEEHLRDRPGIAVLPFGALEQHGPHLPLSTDTLQAGAVARRLAERLDGVLLPAVAFGNTWSNDALPGTVSIGAATVSALCGDIAGSLERSGFAALVVVNGDYGNRLPLHTAAEASAARGGMPVLVLDYPGLVEIGDRVKETPWAAPGLCHADELETSMVLAVAPTWCRPIGSSPSIPSSRPISAFGRWPWPRCRGAVSSATRGRRRRRRASGSSPTSSTRANAWCGGCCPRSGSAEPADQPRAAPGIAPISSRV